MKIKVILHQAEEGGYWAEVPALPGCVTEGDTMEETLANVREAILCYMEAGATIAAPSDGRVEEIEV